MNKLTTEAFDAALCGLEAALLELASAARDDERERAISRVRSNLDEVAVATLARVGRRSGWLLDKRSRLISAAELALARAA